MAQRIYLGVMAALYCATAVYAFIDPETLGRWLGIAPLGASGLTEIRAIYGGLMLGNGLLLAAGVRSRNLALAGLLSVAFGLGCLVLVRLTSEVFSGGPGVDVNQGILILFELAAAGMAAFFAPRALGEDRKLGDSRY